MKEQGDVAARVRSREADAEAADAEQPAKCPRTSKWDQQDSDAVPAAPPLPAQVGIAHKFSCLCHTHVSTWLCTWPHHAMSYYFHPPLLTFPGPSLYAISSAAGVGPACL